MAFFCAMTKKVHRVVFLHSMRKRERAFAPTIFRLLKYRGKKTSPHNSWKKCSKKYIYTYIFYIQLVEGERRVRG
jgi:hypothetical protein